MRHFLAGLIFGIVLVTLPSLAVTPDEMLKDPALEMRARELSAGLRCLVCQNQSIDDSDAPLAHDIRVLLRERLSAGDSDRQVIDFLVSRYGEFILLKPPFAWNTVLLWGTPVIVLLAGAAALAVILRRRRSAPAAALALSPEEEARLSGLLDGRGGENPPSRPA
ncbi:MAG TPA: cytochrome c-type biogenesis protein [Bauldia sp.]|nr:cytochrome c-type biogenesis protein [Bauldia sp.]